MLSAISTKATAAFRLPQIAKALLMLGMVQLVVACGASAPVTGNSATNTSSEALSRPAGAEASETVAASRYDPQQPIPAETQMAYEQAIASMLSGDTIDAELRLQEFLLRYPEYPGAHVNLAIIFADRNDFAAAENSLADALQLNPSHPAALNQLGMLLRRQGKFTEAESAYRKALEVSPDYALAHYNLGVLYELYLKQLENALRHYEAYLTLSEGDGTVEKWVTDLKRRIG